MRHHVLASASPRRHRLLALVISDFEVVPAEVDETPLIDEAPRALVQRLALAKARAVASRSVGDPGDDVVVIAADTTVELEGRILGTPIDADEARTMLGALAGRTHLVHTGLTVRCGPREYCEVVTTEVDFAVAGTGLIEAYLATGEPLDKAGAYGIQGLGSALVAGVRGSLSNVIGLPIEELVTLLARLDPA